MEPPSQNNQYCLYFDLFASLVVPLSATYHTTTTAMNSENIHTLEKDYGDYVCKKNEIVFVHLKCENTEYVNIPKCWSFIKAI